MSQKERIAVTGVGLITSLGTSADACWSALVAGRTGMRPLERIRVAGHPVRDGGEAPPLEGVPDSTSPDARTRARAYLLACCREALRAAGLAGERAPDPDRAALVVGSSLAAGASAPAFWDGWLAKGAAGADYAALRSYDVEPMLDALCAALGVRGESLVVANACAAGASSIAAAADLLRSGRADLAIAAGFDPIDEHTFAGFGALKALTEPPMKPFSVGRAGMKLGDGFAALILEPESHARAAGRKPVAFLVGAGESADAHHLAHPHPEGLGAAQAMQRALAEAGLAPSAIDHVNAHATATPANDGAELKAMRAVFGAHLERIALGASKPAVGHTLGGAGAVEAAITVLALRAQHLPPTLGLGDPEPGFEGLDRIPEARPARLRHAMSNSFGFGGCNASLIFEAAGT